LYVVAGLFHPMDSHLAAKFAKARPNHRAESIDGGLHVARGFDLHKLLYGVDHPPLLFAEISKLFGRDRGAHCQMLPQARFSILGSR
jgi:hypothetical protein